MKSRPPSPSPLIYLGYRISRKRAKSPAWWDRNLPSKLEKRSVDDLVLGMLNLSIPEQEGAPVMARAIVPNLFGLKSSSVVKDADRPPSAKGKDPEHDVKIPAPALALIPPTTPEPHNDLEDHDTQVRNPFRGPVEIPLTTGMWVFPHSASAIDGAFHDRFGEIQNYFRRNTEVHSDLKAHVEHIEYVLKMCGPSVEEAHPSIIVFCRPSEFKALRSLLNEKHLKRQWCRRKSTPSYLFWRNWSKGDNTTGDLGTWDQKPLFDLYFWKTAQPRKLFCLTRIRVQLQTGGSSPLRSSGTVLAVPHPDRLEVSCSTIACTLQADQSFYALTAAHVLRNTPNQSNPRFYRCLSGPPIQNLAVDASHATAETIESNGDSDDDDFVSDIEYTDEPEDIPAAGLFRPTERSPRSTMGHKAGGIMDCTALSQSPTCPRTPNMPDLDWAIVELHSLDLMRPNAVSRSSEARIGSDSPIYFDQAVTKLPKKETAVIIQTSNGIRKATLQPAPAFLGAINFASLESGTYWTLILGDAQGLSDGDSGSVVVDAVTNGVYGHIVASNPIGEVYVSPIVTTMKQVKHALHAEEVILPDSLTALTMLACHYLRERGDEAFRFLAELDEVTKAPEAKGISREQLRAWEQSIDRESLSLHVRTTLTGILREGDANPETLRVLQRFVGKEGTSSDDLPSRDHNSQPQRTTSEGSQSPSPGSSLAQGLDEDAVGMQSYLDERQMLFPDADRQESEHEDDLHPEAPNLEVDRLLSSSRHINTISRARDTSQHNRSRRNSLDEDAFYRQVMTAIPANPPSYQRAISQGIVENHKEGSKDGRLLSGGARVPVEEERPPAYTCDIHLEGVFMRKAEIENTCKRAEFRNWQMVHAELRGTMLIISQVKKERGWWQPKTGQPDISPDNPPWVKRGPVERVYSLLHGDVGIAADYRKRRYVIRLRLENEQFLLSCVELKSFVTWLDNLFAALNIAPVIDERDFPRDLSIPRIQRIRWLRGTWSSQANDTNTGPALETWSRIEQEAQALETAISHEQEEERERQPPARPIVMRRFRMTEESAGTEKWAPTHDWTATHDHLYARLCFSVLLFKSPRKSNYVVCRGILWYVDWSTGRMIRMLPPRYGELELFGPWQIISADNRLI